MPETIYTVGAPGEMDEIIDFINYVFSQAARPHDFKALLPKVYGDKAPVGQECFHFLAKQAGKIVGCVACRPMHLSYSGQTLKCGYIGSVSVHKYHRGEGHMKKLMAMAMADARAKGCDMLILGGQRQRYGYFGFEPAGMALRFHFTAANARHVLSDVDAGGISLRPMQQEDVPFARALRLNQPVFSSVKEETFLDELRSWAVTPLCITENGEAIGYRAGQELVLTDEGLLPKVLKALMAHGAENPLPLTAALYEKERIAYLGSVCESVNLGETALINVFNWPRVLKTFIEFKHRCVSSVSDCVFSLFIDGDGAFEGTVDHGKANVKTLESAPASALRLHHNEAQRLFFGIADMFVGRKGIEPSCLGLPFYMSEQDAF